VTKEPDGKTTVSDMNDSLPDATMGATAIGTLIGMLGGPVGLAVGAASGFLIGAATDFGRTRVERDFVAQVTKELERSKTVLVAQIDEESTEFVDERMKSFGGAVHRHDLSDVADAAYEHEVTVMEADRAQAKAEQARSRSARRAKLQATIDSLADKLKHSFRRADGSSGGEEEAHSGARKPGEAGSAKE
jgi:uncharacterized membrane protein